MKTKQGKRGEYVLYYDPDLSPDPATWLALDEELRITLIAEYHEREGVELPRPVVHAQFHAIVENQIALGEPADAKIALFRLMGEKLSRHDAIHAIASEFAFLINNAVKKQKNFELEVYAKKLRKLTARKWLASG